MLKVTVIKQGGVTSITALMVMMAVAVLNITMVPVQEKFVRTPINTIQIHWTYSSTATIPFQLPVAVSSIILPNRKKWVKVDMSQRILVVTIV
jgi:hypothetical protein